MKEYAFGIDLGGTTAKLGLFTVTGGLVDKWEIPTDASNHGQYILINLAQALKDKMAENHFTKEDIAGVGMGVPGAVTEFRFVAPCANLDHWGGFDVASAFSSMMFDLPVQVSNDANVAALGECWMGAGKGCRNMVMLTLGTGVGGGIVLDGKVLCGKHGAGGELGHVKVRKGETRTCGCGKRGCLEQYCSATGVVRCMKDLLEAEPDVPCVLRGRDFVAKDVFDAAREGDALCLREVNEMADLLGYAICGITATVDPELILIGGGVSRAGSILSDAVQKAAIEYAFPSCAGIPVRIATLGNDAGIYGAVKLVLE